MTTINAPRRGGLAGNAAVDTVVVDYGGVLTNPLAETLVLFATRVGVNPLVLAGAFAAAARECGESPMAALETARITESQLVERLLPHLPPGSEARLQGREFGELWFEGRRPNAPFLQFLREVKASGYQLALLTNNVREWEHRWRAQVPVDELFPVVVNSAHEGVRKPDPRIFQTLLARLDTTAQRCLFVDDDEDNCAAAAALGMAVVHFTDTDSAISAIRSALADGTQYVEGATGVPA
jgi:putative hydrolase of the HAD superfamily